ncbi:MAG TPA: sulfur carrier protein ThiS [Candidatus Hydrogenedentes bacterium]|nr:sulfur carrier protein ThiS [Candidatus Hydrogenedentota bacterium]
MVITLNGERREIGLDATVRQLLDEFGFKPEATAVQRNADILNRAAYADTVLAEGDVVEFVRFVGGG